MQPVKKSSKLDNVCYDIRGPVLARARQMEDEGHRIDERHLGEEGASGQGEHRQIQYVRLAEPIEQGR